MNPLVSIIVPIYNVEDYLDDCFRCIINQTYKNFEVLLVNDGSTDGSQSKCELVSQNDSRFRLINKENGGLSSARNAGIDEAKGEYYYFYDSDDLITYDAIENLVRACVDGKVKIAAVGYQRFQDNDEVNLNSKSDSFTYTVVKNTIMLRCMFMEGVIQHSAWAKLYHKSCWITTRYPEGKYYEDYATTYDVVSSVQRVAISKCVNYYYRFRQSSIMHKGMDERRLDLIDIAYDVTRRIGGKYKGLRNDAVYLMIKNYLWLSYQMLLDENGSYSKELDLIYRRVVRGRKRFLKSKGCGIKDKIKIYSFLINKRVFKRLYALAASGCH